MSPALANFLFEAANFLLLAALLGWALFRPIRKALDAERERHTQREAEAERLRAEAEQLRADTRDARHAADAEIAEQRKQILAAAQREAAALIEQTRQARRAERRALDEELKTARLAATEAVAEAVGALAAKSVRQLLDELPGASLDTALVHAACHQLETLPAAARKSAMVESARSLDGEARRSLEAALGAAFQERIVGELGAGVRITTSAGQVDATASAAARRAAHAVSALGSETSVPANATGGGHA